MALEVYIKEEPVDDDLIENPWKFDISTLLKFCCPECDFRDSSYKIFSDHAKCFHEGAKSLFNWSSAEKAFECPEIREDISHPLLFKKYCCPECSFSHYNIELFQCHAITNHPLSKDMFEDAEGYDDTLEDFVEYEEIMEIKSCQFCRFKSNDHIEIYHHHRITHDTEKPPFYKCDSCLHVSHIPDEVDEHSQKTHKLPYLPYFCPICCFKCSDINRYNRHKKAHLASTSLPGQVLVNDFPSAVIEIPGGFRCSACPDILHVKKHEVAIHFLRKHVPLKNDFEVCQYCIDTFHSTSELKEHYERLHPDLQCYTYKCFKCPDVSYPGLKMMKEHFKLAHKSTFVPFNCDKCGASFYFQEAFMNHCIEKHDEKYQIFKCKQCPMTFHNKSFMVIHQLTHERVYKPPFFCQYCSFTCESEEKILSHHFMVHPTSPPPFYICDNCEFRHVDPEEVEHHSSQVHNTEYYAYKCKDCTYMCKEFLSFKFHTGSHSKGENIFCNICQQGFGEARHFREHKVLVHFGGEIERYDCKHCDFSSIEAMQYNQHIRVNHKRQKQDSCPYCGKKFGGQTKIEIHIDGMHPETGEKKFSCKFCGRKFIYESSMKRHPFTCPKQDYIKKYLQNRKKLPEKTKEEKEGIACPNCDKKFICRLSYGRHLRQIHSEEKNYECEFCGKKKATPHQLSAHIKNVHLKVQCDICQKTLPNSYDLKRHRAFKHNNVDGAWICKICPKKVFFSEETYNKHAESCKGDF